MGTLTIPAAPVLLKKGGCGCTSEARSGGLERLKYFQRQLLTADDMIVEQEYFRQKLRLHNRYLHGWGVVCGLQVTAAPTDEAPWRVQVGPGYALGPQGDEIFVAEPAFVDLSDCGPGAITDPCDPSVLRPVPSRGGVVFVAIRYAECFARPVRSATGCGCDDAACEYSRIRDSFELQCLDELPPSHGLPVPNLCRSRGRVVPCPPEIDDPWLVLARVSLPPTEEVDMANQQIDNSVRRQLFSTMVLQEQLIRCCCGRQDPRPEPVPVRVFEVSPSHGASFDNEGPLSVAVRFDKDVEASSVNPSTFQVFHHDANAPLAGAIAYNPASRTATFTPAKRLGVGEYSVLVRGAGANHVEDVDGLSLDGNKDGTQGDDFKSVFAVSKLA